jgi:hypothetical protein
MIAKYGARLARVLGKFVRHIQTGPLPGLHDRCPRTSNHLTLAMLDRWVPNFGREGRPAGGRHIWLEPRILDRLTALRGPGESYSDVTLRLAKGFAKRAARRGGFQAALLSRARLPLITYTRKGPSYTFQIQLYAPGLSNPSDS